MKRHEELDKLIANDDYECKYNLEVSGDVKVKGRLIVDGNLKVSGNILTEKSIHVKGSLECSGDIKTNHSIEVGQSIDCGGEMLAGDWIEAGRYLRANGDIKAEAWIKATDYIETKGLISTDDCIYILGRSLRADSIKCRMIHFKKDYQSIRRFWAKKEILQDFQDIILDSFNCYDEIREEILKKTTAEDILKWEKWKPLEKLSLQLFFRMGE